MPEDHLFPIKGQGATLLDQQPLVGRRQLTP